jgi:hypothetical protein
MERRDTLKILGAVGATCAFPFAGDELYGQQAGGQTFAPKFFTAREYALVSRVADLIIPRTATPGAVDAGVPAYIDYVVASNESFQKLFRVCLERLENRRFLELAEHEQIAVLTGLSEPGNPQIQFWKAIKGMTADGYYTSKIGLVDELGYQGNMARAEFPACHEH